MCLGRVVTLVEVAVLIAAGTVAGVFSTVVGLASVVSYPALLAIGLPPLSANMTNTVALLFTGLGAAAGSRPELTGQAARTSPAARTGPAAVTGGMRATRPGPAPTTAVPEAAWTDQEPGARPPAGAGTPGAVRGCWPGCSAWRSTS